MSPRVIRYYLAKAAGVDDLYFLLERAYRKGIVPIEVPGDLIDLMTGVAGVKNRSSARGILTDGRVLINGVLTSKNVTLNPLDKVTFGR
ncbi:MAG: hypothetical protein GY771_04415 [bacterium]|nr:hypothetical protein [bacterium]